MDGHTMETRVTRPRRPAARGSARRRIAAGLCGLAILAVGACGDRSADGAPVERTGTDRAAGSAAAASASARETVGTFHAVLDGTERTWYAVSGTVDGERESSAVWIPLESGDERMASLTGFDDPEVPLSTFEFDPARGEISMGDYEGGLLGVTFGFGPDDFERTAHFPGGTDASVMYLPAVPEGELDFSSLFMLAEGVLDVTLIEVSDDGVATFEGSFHGTLRTMDREASMEIVDGRFTIERAVRQEPADPSSFGGAG